MVKKILPYITRQIVILILLLVLLPFLVLAAQLAVKLFGKAEGIKANIMVDYNSSLGPMPKIWQALAQGGEEKGRMLGLITNDIRSLSPGYIRLDHLYDMYDVVKRSSDGKITYDFTQLDETVNDILNAGALPYFSLSYLPVEFGGDVVGKPKNWTEWENLIKATVEHYSGHSRGQKNLDGVYYEVWNEPDLFGKWKTYGTKNYLELYSHTIIGANLASNINNFKIGGPATTGMYEAWMQDFLKFAADNNLRLDFLSYHRYSRKMIDFAEDLRILQNLLNNFPRFINLPIIISEWGSEAGNSVFHDVNFDAIHALSVIRQLIDRVDKAFTFEIKDGFGTKQYWGRWGLITHEKYGLIKKPKYYALKFLNNLSGERLKVDGEGSFVTGLAVKDGDNIRLLLVNYDTDQNNSENVPITFANLPRAVYSLKIQFLFGGKTEEYVKAQNGIITHEIYLPRQSAVLLELTKLAPLYSFSLGYFGNPGNFGLRLNTNDLPLIISKDKFSLPAEGTIEFFLKPLWNDNDQKEISLFNISLGERRMFSLRRKTEGFTKRLEFGTYIDGVSEDTVSNTISSWEKGKWYHLLMSWGKDGLSLFLDGRGAKTYSMVDLTLFGEITFSNFGGVIDELRVLNISSNDVTIPTQPHDLSANTVLLRHFDQTVEN